MRWLAICDASDVPMGVRPNPQQPLPELVSRGTLVLEAAMGTPPSTPRDLIAQEEVRGWQRRLRLTLAPDGRLSLHQQQGAAQAKVDLALTLPRDMQGLRVVYTWDAPRRTSTLSVRILPDGPAFTTDGRNPLPIPAEDIARLLAPGESAARHGSVKWLGLAEITDLPRRDPGLTAGLPILTPSGHVRADSLRPGDLVETADHGALPLIGAARHLLPAQGSFTPIRLRAPYFGASHDLIVGPGQRIALSGAAVDYLFGEDEVLVAARHLVNNRSALYETRRAFVSYLSFRFEVPTAILSMDCVLECPAGTGAPGRPRLHDLARYEAVTLQQMREGQHAQSAA